MKYIEFILISVALASVVYVLANVFGRHFFPRREMEAEAQALLIKSPDAEQSSVYLALRSFFPSGKQREVDSKIDEMKTQGWTFLRAVEASPLHTIRSLGGGLTLHFIRTGPAT